MYLFLFRREKKRRNAVLRSAGVSGRGWGGGGVKGRAGTRSALLTLLVHVSLGNGFVKAVSRYAQVVLFVARRMMARQEEVPVSICSACLLIFFFCGDVADEQSRAIVELYPFRSVAAAMGKPSSAGAMRGVHVSVQLLYSTIYYYICSRGLLYVHVLYSTLCMQLNSTRLVHMHGPSDSGDTCVRRPPQRREQKVEYRVGTVGRVVQQQQPAAHS